MLLLALFVLAYTGFAWLALSQTRHWRRAVGPAPLGRGRVLRLRVGGMALLAGSLVLALLRDGPGFGALLWATAISVAAVTVTFTLAWRPGWLRALVLARR